MMRQFLTQSFMQSAAANAGAGDDNTAAPTVTALMIEAKESRRDWTIESAISLMAGVGGHWSLIGSKDLADADSVWKTENPSADRSNIAPMSIREEASFVIDKGGCFQNPERNDNNEL
mmetsp:Transcript_17771/g.36552  ORF Transcript_17771/g.36552 Transcript_17771/m.36552 type:complete len:118 (+) Transcript_17771:772-1125(+)